MKFTIFKWWEPLVKPFIYTLILIATAGLIVGYCFIRDDDGMIAFAVSISYALVLFLVMIPINKIEKYTSEKLFERESYYLTLKRLRDVTNSTIQKADKNDIDDLIKHIMSFQVFTGRTEGMIEQRLQGKNTPIYINEKGFTYSAHMQKLEIKILKLHNNDGNKKELSKYAKKLCKYYKKICKHLDKNYNRIAQIYGGALFDLIERDSTASDAEYSLSDIDSKLEAILSDISSLRDELNEVRTCFNENQREQDIDCSTLVDKLEDIELILLDIQDEK